MNGKAKFWELFLNEKTFGIFILGVVACWAMSAVKNPETIVAAAIGAIAGFVTAEAAAVMREQRRLTKEENEANVINLQKKREEMRDAELEVQLRGTGTDGPSDDGPLADSRVRPESDQGPGG